MSCGTVFITIYCITWSCNVVFALGVAPPLGAWTPAVGLERLRPLVAIISLGRKRGLVRSPFVMEAMRFRSSPMRRTRRRRIRMVTCVSTARGSTGPDGAGQGRRRPFPPTVCKYRPTLVAALLSYGFWHDAGAWHEDVGIVLATTSESSQWRGQRRRAHIGEATSGRPNIGERSQLQEMSRCPGAVSAGTARGEWRHRHCCISEAKSRPRGGGTRLTHSCRLSTPRPTGGRPRRKSEGDYDDRPAPHTYLNGAFAIAAIGLAILHFIARLGGTQCGPSHACGMEAASDGASGARRSTAPPRHRLGSEARAPQERMARREAPRMKCRGIAVPRWGMTWFMIAVTWSGAMAHSNHVTMGFEQCSIGNGTRVHFVGHDGCGPSERSWWHGDCRGEEQRVADHASGGPDVDPRGSVCHGAEEEEEELGGVERCVHCIWWCVAAAVTVAVAVGERVVAAAITAAIAAGEGGCGLEDGRTTCIGEGPVMGVKAPRGKAARLKKGSIRPPLECLGQVGAGWGSYWRQEVRTKAQVWSSQGSALGPETQLRRALEALDQRGRCPRMRGVDGKVQRAAICPRLVGPSHARRCSYGRR